MFRRRQKAGNVNYQNPWAAQTTARGDPVAAQYGDDHWRPLPTQGPAPLQIGVFGARLLTQFPSYYNQPQLHQGVEGLSSAWFTPNANGPVLASNYQHTQSPSNISGGQRYAGKPGAPLGPLSSKRLAARVAAAQVRQSGLSATQWAQGLTGG